MLYCLWTVSDTSLLYRGAFQEYTILSAKANSAVFIGKGQKNKEIRISDFSISNRKYLIPYVIGTPLTLETLK